MELVREIFPGVKVYKLGSRVDNRGTMMRISDADTEELGIRETRVYSMPKAGTFFGIHYREESSPMTKLVSVIRGRGMDYVIDLRKDSKTYLSWKPLEISEENHLAVLIPAGFGHAFISLTDDTIYTYSIDQSGKDGSSLQLNYKDERIGFKLPVEVTEISDYDRDAPFLST